MQSRQRQQLASSLALSVVSEPLTRELSPKQVWMVELDKPLWHYAHSHAATYLGESIEVGELYIRLPSFSEAAQSCSIHLHLSIHLDPGVNMPHPYVYDCLNSRLFNIYISSTPPPAYTPVFCRHPRPCMRPKCSESAFPEIPSTLYWRSYFPSTVAPRPSWEGHHLDRGKVRLMRVQPQGGPSATQAGRSLSWP